jgi:acetylornithine deacetylase/succinyl-diaminopimelate desuccinylase-like protein
VHAGALIVAKLAVLPVPAKPKTTYNVGKFTGGTTINAIAEEAVLEVDLRSEDPGELDKLELKFLESVRIGVAEENAMRKASGTLVKEEHKIVSNRPGGQTAADSPIVRAALWASKATGHSPSLGYSSTDSNLPISLGIPAVTLGGGGRGNNAHSLDEWFEPDDAFKGPQMVLLTVLAFGQSRIP